MVRPCPVSRLNVFGGCRTKVLARDSRAVALLCCRASMLAHRFRQHAIYNHLKTPNPQSALWLSQKTQTLNPEPQPFTLQTRRHEKDDFASFAATPP